MNQNQDACKNEIPFEEFCVELLSAVSVCFEGKAERQNGAIVYSAPNGQQFRIAIESLS